MRAYALGKDPARTSSEYTLVMSSANRFSLRVHDVSAMYASCPPTRTSAAAGTLSAQCACTDQKAPRLAASRPWLSRKVRHCSGPSSTAEEEEDDYFTAVQACNPLPPACHGQGQARHSGTGSGGLRRSSPTQLLCQPNARWQELAQLGEAGDPHGLAACCEPPAHLLKLLMRTAHRRIRHASMPIQGLAGGQGLRRRCRRIAVLVLQPAAGPQHMAAVMMGMVCADTQKASVHARALSMTRAHPAGESR